MNGRLVVLFVGMIIGGCGTPISDGGACASDAECKGGRICDGGGCVDPATAGQSHGEQGGPGGQPVSDTPQSVEPGAYGSFCEGSSDCHSDLCIVESLDEGRGICSQQCNSNSDCPADHTCQELSNLIGSACGPVDVEECKDSCAAYVDRLDPCVDSATLAACQSACTSAAVEDRVAFSDCADTEAGGFECLGTACLEQLGVEAAELVEDCSEDAEMTAFCGGFMVTGFVCENSGTPDDRFFAFCELEGVEEGTSFYCCQQ